MEVSIDFKTTLMLWAITALFLFFFWIYIVQLIWNSVIRKVFAKWELPRIKYWDMLLIVIFIKVLWNPACTTWHF